MNIKKEKQIQRKEEVKRVLVLWSAKSWQNFIRHLSMCDLHFHSRLLNGGDFGARAVVFHRRGIRDPLQPQHKWSFTSLEP